MASGNLTTNSTTEEFTLPVSPNYSGNTWLHLHLSGSFGGGTFTLYFYTETEGAKAISNGVFSAPDDAQIFLKPGTVVYGELTGASSPNLVYSMR